MRTMRTSNQPRNQLATKRGLLPDRGFIPDHDKGLSPLIAPKSGLVVLGRTPAG